MNPMAMRWCRLYKGTPAEHAVEAAVASIGVPYRTQFPGYLYGLRFFPDFVFPTLGVVLEIDDPSHDRADKIAADIERTAEIKRAWGYDVVRITNKAAQTNPDEAVRTALASVGKYPVPQRLPSVESSLPKPRSAGQAQTRAAKAQAIRTTRSTPRKRPN